MRRRGGWRRKPHREETLIATFNSNLVTAGQQCKSVAPGTISPVFGSVTIAANTTLASTTSDTIQLFSMPGPSSHLVGGWLDNPILDSTNTLRWSLTDGTNAIIPNATFATSSAALRIVLQNNGAAAHILMGSGVTYTVNTPIYIAINTGAGATIGGTAVVIYFCFFVAQD